MLDIQHDSNSVLVVGARRVAMVRSLINVIFRAEEAGTYLATYKAFEHKPPNMIKERVDKDYHAILRSALTSINKVNKMDVETLRTSLGVSVLVFGISLGGLSAPVLCEHCARKPRTTSKFTWLWTGKG